MNFAFFNCLLQSDIKLKTFRYETVTMLGNYVEQTID